MQQVAPVKRPHDYCSRLACMRPVQSRDTSAVLLNGPRTLKTAWRPPLHMRHYTTGTTIPAHICDFFVSPPDPPTGCNRCMKGDGVYIDKNSNRYEGQWRNDRAEGYGIKVFAKGDKHEGYYSNDKRNGFGTYYWANGCVVCLCNNGNSPCAHAVGFHVTRSVQTTSVPRATVFDVVLSPPLSAAIGD